MEEQDKHNLADVSKHTPGKADARRWMGSESDPRWTIMLGGAVRFITAGDNDENNAVEAKRRWNSHEPGGSHDALLKACEKASYMNCHILTRDKPDWLKQLEAALELAKKGA